jgi:hypothetical protein
MGRQTNVGGRHTSEIELLSCTQIDEEQLK